MRLRHIFFMSTVALLAPLAIQAKSMPPASINLPVPFLWEIPGGTWVKPWNNACEESSVAMVENYYLNNKKMRFPAKEAKAMMWPFFSIEDKLFGSNADTNSTRTLKVINDYTSFDATIKKNPTLEEIKAELTAGRPVISLHYGFGLKNPLHRFRRGGSSYHVMVLTGFDDRAKKFFVNDPELAGGLDFPYSYGTILTSLHDFNHTTKKADGTPTVLFTAPKLIVKTSSHHSLYLIRDNKKYYISRPEVFKNHRWNWGIVKTISQEKLDGYALGGKINK